MATITPQQKALHALIVDGHAEILSEADYSKQWFYDPRLADILTACQILAYDGKPICRDEIINCINATDWYSNKKSVTIAALLEVLEPQIYDLAFLPKALSEEYTKNVEEALSGELLSDTATRETKAAAIEQAFKALTFSGHQKSKTLGEVQAQYFSDLDNGVESKFNQRCLHFTTMELHTIFKGQVFPELYVIAGRPRFGKTQLLINLVNDLGRRYRGMVFTFEDSCEKFAMKCLANLGQVPYDSVARGLVPKPKLESMREQYKAVGDNVLVDPSTYTIDELTKIVRREALTRDLRWVAVDYCQRFRYNRRDEVAELNYITKGLAGLTKEFMMPVFALSQLNDRKESGEKGEKAFSPILGNLKGTSALEEDARIVMLLGGIADDCYRTISVAKNDYGPLYTMIAEMDLPSGKILSARMKENELR